MDEYYLDQVLGENGKPYHGGTGTWSLPTDKPGEWMPRIDNIVPCERGYHLCRRGDLVNWLGPVIYEAEYRGEMVEADDKIVVSEARLIRRLDTWNERTARLFACDCAERVVHLNDDPRVQACIDIARRYANGQATLNELDAASDAAWDAEKEWQTEKLFEYLGEE